MLSLAVVSIAAMLCESSPAPPIYSADFSTPLDLAFEADLLDATGTHRVRVPTAAWVLESVNNGSIAYTNANDNMVMENNGAHMVLWANRPFPAEGEVRFGVMPANTSVGLSIIFYGTMPLRNVTKYANATTIFDLSLPPRGGNYPAYHGGKGGKGSIVGYSDSYWRAGNGTQQCDRNPNDGKCTANLRKNPGFVMAAQGDDLILGRAPKNGKAFEIVLRRVGATTTVSVDGVASLEYTDDGGMSAPFKGGYVGLRQMLTTRVGVYTHFDVHPLDDAPKRAPGPPKVTAYPSSFQARCAATLALHINKPFPKPSTIWGVSNLALARLALNGSTNATLAALISAEVAAYATMPAFMPWGNYTVKGTPMGGLGTTPVLARLALLPRLRALLSADAIASIETILFAWLSPRSSVEWASASDGWRLVDGSENLDATRKAALYFAALAVNRSSPDKIVALDGKPVRAHAAAWETHWRDYFNKRANEGIGVEFGSPTYAKYALQNFINIIDLSSSASLRKTAGGFLQLWFADAAQAFLPSSGQRGGAHNRVYRDAAFFSLDSSFSGFTWLYGWWNSSNVDEVEAAQQTPQATLFATSMWEPLPIVTAMATVATPIPEDGVLYISRRLGDREECSAPLGPHCPTLPCKICTVCGLEKVPAFIGDECTTIAVPTTVVKQEFIASHKRYTLGAVSLNVAAAKAGAQQDTKNYVAGVIQNHQIGAFLGGANPPMSRLLFGDSGSTNCSDAAFQRHSYGGMTSTLVRGAVVVARPVAAKINACNICKNSSSVKMNTSQAAAGAAIAAASKLEKATPCSPPGTCAITDFPLWLFASSDLYATKVDVVATKTDATAPASASTSTTHWSCFNGADETFACAALAGTGSGAWGEGGGSKFTPSPCNGMGSKNLQEDEGQEYTTPHAWNGTLLAFNESKSSSDFGILQMGSIATHAGFDAFLRAMRRQVVAVDPVTGAMEYVALSGDTLRLGEHGVLVPAFRPKSLTFDSPFIRAKHIAESSAEPFTVQLRFPGFENQTLLFG
jgi:hypothetical protein